jgi:hypothetical protein
MENTLTTRQLHREYSFNHIYLDFLNKMIAEKQKQIRFRKWFYNQLKRLSLTVFETEDEEYEAIQKYGRGIWETTQYDKNFSKNDLIIIRTIAQDFGAFDY